jgi:hypothetical protein
MDILECCDDQNQGARKPALPPLGASAWLRDLYHPDFNRRLWHFTRSADPEIDKIDIRRSRALALNCKYRRWGISPRPENAANPFFTKRQIGYAIVPELDSINPLVFHPRNHLGSRS